jgi:hypothetical protein
MKYALAAVIALAASSAHAGCFGSSSFQTCNDNSGNSYTINRFGNTTMMQGHNSRTGSNWSQQSTTFGNTTMHSGQDAAGDSWNSTCVNGYCN